MAMWIEDFSGVKLLFDRWRSEGVEDLRAWLKEDVSRVAECSGAIRVLRVNRKTLELFEADNQAAANTAITAPVAVLSATMVADRSTVYAGGVTRWTIHYRNDGTTAVDGVTLTASVPSNATLVAGSLSAGSEAGGVITASVGELDLGEAGAISFATVAGASGNQTGTLSITGDDACPTAGAYPVVVNATLGLTATKAASRATACGDGQITWSITLANQGTTDLTGLTVRDAVPAGSASIHVLYVDGSYEDDSGSSRVLGFAYGGSFMVMFKDSITSGCASSSVLALFPLIRDRICARVEATVLNRA